MFRSKFFNTILSIFLLVSVPVAVFVVLQKTNFLNIASGTPANFYVDSTSTFGIAGQSWKNLAQGGEEKGDMIATVIPKVAALKPEYIRIDHIYDSYDLVQGGPGNLSFNWTNLDATVRSILATGALPFFSLSYMPPSIAKNSYVDEVPINWSDWENLTEQTIEHYSGKSGFNLNGVYYEVWNEPDLFGGFKIGGTKNYLDLYQHAAIGASRAKGVNNFKLGGPSTTDLYKNWFDSFLQFCQNNNIRLDFFSWHKYSKDLGDYDNQVKSIQDWIKSYPSFANLEFDITENGINGSNDSANDGGLSAIQTIATTAVLQGNIRRSFLFEIKDGPGTQQYWGRWGILTNQKFGDPVAKPRYNAVVFLNRMIGDNVTVSGQGSWVKAFAKKNGGKIDLLVVNYDPSGKHSEAVPIRIDKLTNGSYSAKRTDFGGGVRTRQVEVTANVIDFTDGFSPNTAAIFEIAPM